MCINSITSCDSLLSGMYSILQTDVPYIHVTLTYHVKKEGMLLLGLRTLSYPYFIITLSSAFSFNATWLWLPWLCLPLRALLISSDKDVSPCYDVKLLLSKFYFASLPSTFPDTMEFSNLQLFMMWPKGLDCLLLIWALALFARWLFFTRCLRCFYLSKAFPALF